MAITSEQCKFISDVWLSAAQHYWYLEGYNNINNDKKEDKIYQILFWNSVAAANYGHLLDLTN